MKCVLGEFDAVKLAATTQAWLEAATALGVPTLDFEKTLAWVGSHDDYEVLNGDSYAYGVFADTSDVALAVVDIVYSRRAGPDLGWLKMLSVSLAPQFCGAVLSKDAESAILPIYVEAVRGTVSLTDVHRSRVVKLYARSDEFTRILLSLNEYVQEFGHELDLTSKFEGRFLVITAI